jgi:TatD DNase family protein
MYIDTHSHLNSPVLYQKLLAVIEEAKEEQVAIFIVPGYDYETSQIALELAHKFPFIYAAIGYHPTEIKGYGEKEYAWLEEHVQDEKVVAIGEVGFDFYWDSTTKEEQLEAFERQISIAKKANKPLIIHSREAIQLTLEILRKNDASVVGGVMHAYSGSLEMAPLFIKENFYLGIGGPVTFKNAKDAPDVCKWVPLDKIFVETDAPFLTPHPFRGKENEPFYTYLTFNKVCEIKELDETTLMNQMEENYFNLFTKAKRR